MYNSMNKEFKMAYQDLRRELVKQNIPRDEKLKRLLNFLLLILFPIFQLLGKYQLLHL